MANPSKAKGTGYETKLVAFLRPIWGAVERSSAGKESCDFTGTGTWVVEAKKRARWDIPDWVRRIRRVAGPNDEWVIFIEPGDLRSNRDLGEIAVMDAHVARAAILAYEEACR